MTVYAWRIRVTCAEDDTYATPFQIQSDNMMTLPNANVGMSIVLIRGD